MYPSFLGLAAAKALSNWAQLRSTHKNLKGEEEVKEKKRKEMLSIKNWKICIFWAGFDNSYTSVCIRRIFSFIKG